MVHPEIILCGHAKDDARIQGKRTALATFGDHDNVTLKISDISEKVAQRIEDRFLDLLEIATYVYCADQSRPRGGAGVDNMGDRWRRPFVFRVAVRDPDFWNDPGVNRTLVEALDYLSDDSYEFSFSKIADPPQAVSYFEFPTDAVDAAEPESIVLFSGGLDSLGGAIQEIDNESQRCVLVSHRPAAVHDKRQKDLARALADRGNLPLHVSIWVNKDKSLTADTTQRARSFLYATLAATVARAFGTHRIRFYENGVTSLNLPPCDQVIGARATRTTHPKSLGGFAKLFTMVAGEAVFVENPFFWKTKADVVELIASAGRAALIKHTVSCSHVYEQTKLRTHCGCCIQCIERRFAVLASGRADDDPAEQYAVDLLLGDRAEGSKRTMIESLVRRARLISSIGAQQFLTSFPEVTRAIRHLPGTSGETAERIYEMHRRHATYVNRVVADGIREHADQIASGAISDSCLLALVQPRTQHRPHPKSRSHSDTVPAHAKARARVLDVLSDTRTRGLSVKDLAARARVSRQYLYSRAEFKDLLAARRLHQYEGKVAHADRASTRRSKQPPGSNGDDDTSDDT